MKLSKQEMMDVIEFAANAAATLIPLGVTYFEHDGMKLMFAQPLQTVPLPVPGQQGDGLTDKDRDELERLMDSEPTDDPSEDPATFGHEPPSYRASAERRKKNKDE